MNLLEHFFEDSSVGQILVFGVLNRLQKLAHRADILPLVPADHFGRPDQLLDRLHSVLVPDRVEGGLQLELFSIVHFYRVTLSEILNSQS